MAEEIDLKFVEEIVHEKVLRFEVSSGSKPGDNFLSNMYNIDVVLASDPGSVKHVIVKTYPALKERQAMLNRNNIFLKELTVYKDLLPQLSKFQKVAVPEVLEGKATDFTDDVPNESDEAIKPLENYMAMVNVCKTYGFKMAEKTVGLDIHHLRLVVKELARFHAVSWAFIQSKGHEAILDQFPYCRHSVMAERNPEVEELCAGNLKMALSLAERKLGKESKVAEVIRRIAGAGSVTITEMFLPTDGVVKEASVAEYLKGGNPAEGLEPWSTFIHGDTWVNNMLFRYDDSCKSDSADKPIEVLFVDLQLVHYTCPTTDLAYLFFTSTTKATRDQHLEELLKLYYETFKQVCKTLGAEPFKDFTFDNLKKRYQRAKLFGFIIATLILPIILCENQVDLDKVEVDKSGPSKNLNDIYQEMLSGDQGNVRLEERFLEIFKELVDDGVF